MHGRLFLTHHGFMLDELKSLLQKSLRRKDRDLVLSATKELLYHGKDQLPWKSIATFLFEDHALNSHKITQRLLVAHAQKDKYSAVLLLLNHCGTCRIPACLPVIALDQDYDPVSWDPEMEVEPELHGLVQVKAGGIQFDLLLQHLKKAWLARSQQKLITYMKLATMVHDEESRTVTQKGEEYVKILTTTKGGKKTMTSAMVVLTMLSHLARDDDGLYKFLTDCIKLLSCIPEAPPRLVLCNALAQHLYKDQVRVVDDVGLDKVSWKDVAKLDSMPSWAVDKHTFRGKFGKGTRHLLKKPQLALMSEAELNEFHGVRPKTDVVHFFTEGCNYMDPVVIENPFWERTQILYLDKPHKLQKTVRMTAVYYRELKTKFPAIFHNKPHMSDKAAVGPGDMSDDLVRIIRKRTRQSVELSESPQNVKEVQQKKKRKLDHTSEELACDDYASTSAENDSARPDCSDGPLLPLPTDSVELGFVDGPLLQLPTGSAKVYVRLDLASNLVWKGPYRDARAKQVIFFHRAMRDILGDSHTLPATRLGKYIYFPLYKDPESVIKITRTAFYDCIAKKQVENGEFVLRDSLGIIQVHNLPADKMADLPMSFWAHFLFRFTLNVGDSGLYNAITDKNMTFLYGIDMDDVRKNINSQTLLDYLFVKRPRKALCDSIIKSIKAWKDKLVAIMSRDVNAADMQNMATSCGLCFEEDIFEERLGNIRKALAKL